MFALCDGEISLVTHEHEQTISSSYELSMVAERPVQHHGNFSALIRIVRYRRQRHLLRLRAQLIIRIIRFICARSIIRYHVRPPPQVFAIIRAPVATAVAITRQLGEEAEF